MTYSDLSEIKKILEKENPKSVFLITGRRSYKSSGAKEIMHESLKGYATVHFAEYEINPRLEDIVKASNLVRVNECDLIIAIGGGTALDIAKATSLLTKQEGEYESFIRGLKKAVKDAIPVVAVPTTAGTGSEATHFAVVYIGKEKCSFADNRLVPKYVILDAKLTMSLSPYVTACTGYDALAQGIEGYWSVHSTEESRIWSREAIKLAVANLLEAVKNPTLQVRSNMLRASYLAGKGINVAKTTAAHAVSYPMTAYFNVPHGHAVALTLPSFFEFNGLVNTENVQDERGLDFVKDRMRELQEIIGASTANDAKKKLITLMDECGLQTKLSEVGITNKELIIENGFNPGRVKNNPRMVTEENLRVILEEIA